MNSIGLLHHSPVLNIRGEKCQGLACCYPLGEYDDPFRRRTDGFWSRTVVAGQGLGCYGVSPARLEGVP